MPIQKFGKIYNVLKERIEAGIYQVGELLPSENMLMSEFEASRNTIRRAISNLVKDGYVQTQQGKGVFNIFQSVDNSFYKMGHIETFQEKEDKSKQNIKTKVVTFDKIVADTKICALSSFPVGTSLFYIELIHYVDDIPSIYNISYLKSNCMPNLNKTILEKSLYNYLEQELNMFIVTSKRKYTVNLATDKDRDILNLDNYNCVAVVESSVYNSQGIMFEFTQSRHDPKVFKFQENAIRRNREI